MNTILYFTADWCNPCKKVKPIAEELIRDGANIKFIDVDVETEMTKRFEIMSVPTFVVIRDNAEICRASGVQTMQELNELLRYETSSPGVPVNLEEKIENFIMFFTADWCAPCQKTKPIVEELNREQTMTKFFIIDVDDAPQMKKDFKIEHVPTYIFIKNGEEVRRQTGGSTKTRLKEFLNYFE